MAKVIRRISLDRKIDKFNLEEELAKQADIFYHWAKKAGEAKEERDQLKVDLKKLEGQTVREIYTGAYPIPIDSDKKPIKLTKDTVTAILDTDEEVNKKRVELVKADGVLSKAVAAEEAMQQKRSSLKHLTELYINEYYSQSGAGTSVKVNKTDKVQKGARDSLNKKKTKKENT